ncbi:hypothetical protein RVBP21_2660 [Pseudomonas phage BRkr]|nr:hypothetical protein RVBP21_2660 [Pseudomonas phage BRkr]
MAADGNRVIYVGGYNQGGNPVGPFSTIYTYNTANNTWGTSNTSDVARFEATGIPLAGGQVIDYSGWSGTTMLPNASRIDVNPTGGVSTTPLPNIPAAYRTRYAGSCRNGNDIYIGGGLDSAGSPVDTFFLL